MVIGRSGMKKGRKSVQKPYSCRCGGGGTAATALRNRLGPKVFRSYPMMVSADLAGQSE